MEISDNLLCLYSADLTERDGSYVIEVPESEVTKGAVDDHATYRVALLGPATEQAADARPNAQATSTQDDSDHRPTPPVADGETRDVEITALGDQGDGIAKVDRGYVVIVPGTTVGETVPIEIVHVTDSYAVGDVINQK